MMSKETAGRTITGTSSTDSDQGSAPLSDPFVAVAAGGVSTLGSVMRVEAPGGSAQLLVHRSSHVASSRLHQPPTTASGSAGAVADVPSGRRRKPGDTARILDPVSEETAPTASLVVPARGGGGPWASATPQFELTAGTGCKCLATSAAPGSDYRGPVAKRLASAADFSPTHFNEPVSGGLEPAGSNSLSSQPSAAKTKLELPAHVKVSQRPSPPSSSPISKNPLLGRETPMVIQTPSPPRRQPQYFCTNNGNTAWATAQGLHPIQEGFSAPGYVPAQLVGGISYTVRSLQA
jgi:hypothetical protein